MTDNLELLPAEVREALDRLTGADYYDALTLRSALLAAYGERDAARKYGAEARKRENAAEDARVSAVHRASVLELERDEARARAGFAERELLRRRHAEHPDLAAERSRADGLAAEVERLRAALNTPELHDFAEAVKLEAAHQRERWGSDHDAGKSPEDWMWVVAYLSTKATQAARYGDGPKYLHHIITTAAACANWHAHAAGIDTRMRPGIDPVARGIEPADDAARAALTPKETKA